MDKNIKEAMEAALKKALPQMQSDLLQQRLAEADNMETELKDVKTALKNTKKTLVETEEAKVKAEKIAETWMKKEADVKNREINATNREEALRIANNEIEMKLLKTKLEMTENSRKDIFNLTDSVFRNRTVQEVVHKSVHHPTATNFNADGSSYQIAMPGNSDETVTKTEVIQQDSPKEATDLDGPNDPPIPSSE